jgi:peroxiredoxin
MTTAYDLLGTHPGASREELQTAYDSRMAEYAPERVAALPDDLQQLATQRRAQIQAAFRELRTTRGAPSRLAPDAERRRDRQTIAALFVLLALALLVPLARPFAVPARTVAVTGAEAAALSSDVAPDFTAETLDGQTIRLSEYRGKVVLLNFWATWCPPCVRETPRLVQVAEQFNDQGLVVLGVNTTFQDDVTKVRQFVADQGIGYQVLLDPDGAVGEKYPARLMPTTYLIDRDGRIVHTKVGEVDAATLLEQVGSVLEK